MTAALATAWHTAAQVAELTGRSHWVVRTAVARGRAHSHFTGPRHAGQHFLLEAPVRLWLQGASVRRQREVCAACRGEVPDPPLVLGRARRRHP